MYHFGWTREINGITVKDLGYRNSFYALDIGGKIYKFPTIEEAYEYLYDMEDSGE